MHDGLICHTHACSEVLYTRNAYQFICAARWLHMLGLILHQITDTQCHVMYKLTGVHHCCSVRHFNNNVKGMHHSYSPYKHTTLTSWVEEIYTHFTRQESMQPSTLLLDITMPIWTLSMLHFHSVWRCKKKLPHDGALRMLSHTKHAIFWCSFESVKKSVLTI